MRAYLGRIYVGRIYATLGEGAYIQLLVAIERLFKILKMKNKNDKEKLIGEDFDFFDTKFVEVNWSDYLASEPQLFDCSFDDAMSGLDVYALCLNLGLMPDEKSLLFYNNYSNSTKSLEGDYDRRYGDMPDFDQCFILNPQNLDKEFDEILFIIGRHKR